MSEHDIIPKSWQLIKLSEAVSDLQSGKRPKGGVQGIENGVPSIGAEHLNNDGDFKFEKIKFVPLAFAKQMTKGVIKAKDIIVVKDGATTGKTSFVNSNFPFKYAVINEHVFILRLIKQVLPEFAFYRIWSQKGKNEILEDFRGAAQGGISSSFINYVNIPIPPFSEQQRIVAKIEELFSSLDKGIESLKTAQQQLKVYRQSVLKWAFEGKLTDSTMGTVKLGDHTDLITKGASPRWQGFNYIDDQTQLLFITSENVRENFVDISKSKYLSLAVNKILKRSILKKEDVLFNLVGASIGRAAVFNFDKISNINQAVAVIRLKETMFNKYLSLFLNSELAKQKYLEKIVDVARANLSLTDVANIQIPLPLTKEEQHRIVAEIESRLSVCDKIEESIEESLKQAEALRQSILKKAFEGKLVAQAPNDLPAPRPGVWFVYVLECEDGSYYKGFTKDILERWKQHAMGKGAEWTAKHPPRKLVHWEEFTSEHAAVQREKELKSGFGRKWLEREIKAGRTRQAGEPASILLVRIKAEREKNKKNK